MQTAFPEVYGKVQGKKALMIYSSYTGNTEKIAQAFERVLRAYGFELDVIKATDDQTRYMTPGYDLYIGGGGVINGLSERAMRAGFGGGGNMHTKYGTTGMAHEGKPQWGRGIELKKCVLFLTYGGMRRGPAELAGAFGLLENGMMEGGFNVVGEFACPGFTTARERSFNQYQGLAEDLGCTFTEAVPILEAYIREPESEIVKGYSPETRAACEKAKNAFQEEDEWFAGTPGPWRNMTIDRPSERDILKAELFMAEIIEDVFLPSEKENISSMYRCIC